MTICRKYLQFSFYSHNCAFRAYKTDFFFSELLDINSQLQVIKSELQDINLQSWEIMSQLRNINVQFWLSFSSCNCEFISCNSDIFLSVLTSFLRIVRYKLAIASYKVQFWGKNTFALYMHLFLQRGSKLVFWRFVLPAQIVLPPIKKIGSTNR